MSHLARPCKPRKAHGDRALKALGEDRLPAGVSFGPHDVTHVRPAFGGHLSSGEISSINSLQSQLDELSARAPLEVQSSGSEPSVQGFFLVQKVPWTTLTRLRLGLFSPGVTCGAVLGSF